MLSFQKFLIEHAKDKDGNELEDMNGKPIDKNPDGTVTLYHRTTNENARAIKTSGNWHSKENTQEVWFSNKQHGHAEPFGDGVVKVKIHPRHTRISDAFRDGEIHVAVHRNSLKKRHIQKDDE